MLPGSMATPSAIAHGGVSMIDPDLWEKDQRGADKLMLAGCLGFIACIILGAIGGGYAVYQFLS